METLFNRLGKIGVAFLGAGFFFTRFIFVVDGGERGVLFDKVRGIQQHVYQEGMHFMVPVLHVSQLIPTFLDAVPVRDSRPMATHPLADWHEGSANRRDLSASPLSADRAAAADHPEQPGHRLRSSSNPIYWPGGAEVDSGSVQRRTATHSAREGL